jgi:hypothetical protein
MKTIYSFLLFFLFLFSAKATHNRAGEIVYKRIAPFTNVVGTVTVQVYTYSITLIKYTDDGVGIADRCADTIYFGDGSKGLAPRINGSTNCGCGVSVACGSLIVSIPNYKVKYNVYSIIHQYPGVGNYLISSFDPNRNQGVHNIPNSVNQPFYLESLLIINSISANNSSPVLTNPPINQATVGVCFYYNVGAIDADGDSLSYELTPCRTIGGQSVNGYFYPETGFAGTFSINALTGLLTWCTPQLLTEYNIAILVKEWRKNTSGVPQLMGYVLRDMQILVRYGVVGIQRTSYSSEIRVFPNPFEERLEVDLQGRSYEKLESSIYTMYGELVFSSVHKKVQGSRSFNLNTLNAGTYILSIQAGDEIFRQKIIKR